MKRASILGYLAMVGGLLGLMVVRALLARSVGAAVLQAFAVGLMIWARVAFGRRSFHPAADPTPGGLVTRGPYRRIRHPIYTSVCLFAAAGALPAGSWAAGACLGVLVAGALARMHCEEALLTAQMPGYREYRTRTWRMIPGIF